MDIYDIFPVEIWLNICEYIFLSKKQDISDAASLLCVSPKLTYLIIKYIKDIDIPYFIRKRNTWNRNDDSEIRQKLKILFPEINKTTTSRKKPFYDTVCTGTCKKGKYRGTMWYQKKIDIEGDNFQREISHYQYFREKVGTCPLCKIHLPPLCTTCYEPVVYDNDKLYNCQNKKCAINKMLYITYICNNCDISKYRGAKYIVSKKPFCPYIFTLFTLDTNLSQQLLINICKEYYENKSIFNIHICGFNGKKKIEINNKNFLNVLLIPETLLDAMMRFIYYK